MTAHDGFAIKVVRVLLLSLLVIVPGYFAFTALDEIYDLNALYVSTNGAGWLWRPEEIAGLRWRFGGNCSTRYDASCDPCDGGWQGVECVYEPPLGPAPDCGGGPSRTITTVRLGANVVETLCINSTIVRIGMDSYGLVGPFPASMSLSNVREVSLTCNQISGPLPQYFFNSSSILNLTLYNNSMSGAFPDVLSAGALRSMNVMYNRLTGTIPDSIGRLSSLQMLFIGYNMFSKTIPEAIGSLTDLFYLSVAVNSLTGTLPSSIGSLGNLNYLVTHSNKLGPKLPPQLVNLTSLRFLGLASNCFSGTIPSDLVKLENLVSLRLGRNNLSGDIPMEIYTMTTLSGLEININPRLRGRIPPELGNLTNLVYVSLEESGRFGQLPDSLTNLTNLRVFQIDNNELSGTLPTFIGQWSLLRVLDMDSNKFYGTIPLQWSNLTDLVSLDVSANKLNGTLPNFLLNFKQMRYFEIDCNSFYGQIPSNLFTAYSILDYLDLKKNMLTGLLPIDSCINCTIRVLNANDNRFTGPFPTRFDRLSRLQYFDVARNYLTGTIDDSIGCLSNIKSLIFNGNNIRGSIPSSIGRLSELEIFVASSNSLDGTLPTSIGNLLKLHSIVLQGNNFKGKVDVFSEPRLSLAVFDIADNAFTGSFPLQLFNHSTINTVSASENCFHGEISSQICNLAPNLEELIIDGLTSGTRCHGRWSSRFNLLYKRITGTLPQCLFSMPQLKTLYASGNGIEGEIPDIPSDSKLEKVKLSWNELGGTLPASFQQHRFVELDLSKNKITGVLDSFENRTRVQSGDILNLKNNRFSGNIPRVFYRFDEIDVLLGNMLDCDVGGDLPPNDPNRLRYICGSKAVNSALYVWIGCCIFSLIVAAVAARTALGSSNSTDVCSRLASKLVHIKNSIVTIVGDLFAVVDVAALKPGISLLFPRVMFYYRIYSLVRRIVVRVTAVIVLVFLPLYTLFSVIFKFTDSSSFFLIYQNQYVWTVSNTWNSGVGYASMIFVLWVGVVLYVSYLMYPEIEVVVKNRFIVKRMAMEQIRSKHYDAASSQHDSIRDSDTHSTAASQRISSRSVIYNSYEEVMTTHFSDRFLQSEKALIVVNIVVVIFINMMFISGMQSDFSVGAKSFLQLLLPVLTILWGRCMDVWIMYLFSGKVHSPYRLYFGVLLFNMCFAPFIASVFVDSNCFLYLVEDPAPIVTETATDVCQDWANISLFTYCAYIGSIKFVTKFTPSFSYHSMCSHSIISRYMPSIILFYVFNCFLIAPAKYKLFSRSSNDLAVRMLNFFPSWCRDLVPKYLLSPEVNEQSYNKFPSARMLATSHVNLTVLLTFGLVFPPLAVIIALFVLVQFNLHAKMIVYMLNTWFETQKIGNSKTVASGKSVSENPIHALTSEGDTDADQSIGPLSEAADSDVSAHAAAPVDPTVLDVYLSADCSGFLPCNRLMISSCALFYSIVMSDMSGDEMGPIAIVFAFGACFLVLLAILVVRVYQLRRYVVWSETRASDGYMRRFWKIACDAFAFMWDSFTSSDDFRDRSTFTASLNSETSMSTPSSGGAAGRLTYEERKNGSKYKPPAGQKADLDFAHIEFQTFI